MLNAQLLLQISMLLFVLTLLGLLGIFCCRCLLAFCFYMLLILLLMLKLLFYLLWFMKVSMESSRASMKFVWWIGEGVPVNFEAKLWSR